MNPNRAENQANIEVGPAPEVGSIDQESEPQPARTQENAVTKHSPQTASATTTVDPSLLAQPAASLTVGDGDDAVQTSNGSTPTAQGSDRIEKEWVAKAKAIVDKTQDDPYTQKDAVSKVKAEYIKKRFNKAIKTDDTVTA